MPFLRVMRLAIALPRTGVAITSNANPASALALRFTSNKMSVIKMAMGAVQIKWNMPLA